MHLRQVKGRFRAVLAERGRLAREIHDTLAQGFAGISIHLESVAETLTGGTSVAATVTVLGEFRRLPGAVEHNLLRVGQEALTNAVKHANAQTIMVELAIDPGRVLLAVRDAGCGFLDAQRFLTGANGHFGLFGMRERTEQLGGKLTIKSTPGKGTEIIALLPVARSLR